MVALGEAAQLSGWRQQPMNSEANNACRHH
jgi:hypothetical protein